MTYKIESNFPVLNHSLVQDIRYDTQMNQLADITMMKSGKIAQLQMKCEVICRFITQPFKQLFTHQLSLENRRV